MDRRSNSSNRDPYPNEREQWSHGDDPGQHGAEAQNYGFTQALDWNLAMFTPGGTSRMVRMNQMPAVLSDLATAGYLVVWNKRYGETDPRLGGSADSRGAQALSEIRTLLYELFEKLAEIRRTADPAQIASAAQSRRRMPGLMQQELGLMARRIGAQRDLGTEQSRIYRFHRQLMAFFKSQTSDLKALRRQEFGSRYATYDGRVRALHSKLQRAIVGATTGTGQSSEEHVTSWLRENRHEIEQLRQYWS